MTRKRTTRNRHETAHDVASEDEARPSETNEPSDSAAERHPIGNRDEYVRAMSFSGSGFDSIMQLGVAHALLVIRGKAPDVVVGVSAGAIQATALVEILGEGDDENLARLQGQRESPGMSADLDGEAYGAVLAARVRRFREFLSAYYKAPEKLVRDAWPNAYQIDAHDPLHPLWAPRFRRQERMSRKEDVRRKAGLVRLYNDLLRVHIPIGTVVRLARRILGYRAADELPFWLKIVEKTREAVRTWILIGNELMRATDVTAVLSKPVVKAGASKLQTAGSLIYRFEFVEKLVRFVTGVIFFLLVATLWLGVTSLPLYAAWKLLELAPNPPAAALVSLVVVLAAAIPRWRLRAVAVSILQVLWIALRWFSVYLGLWLGVSLVRLFVLERSLPPEFLTYIEETARTVVTQLIALGLFEVGLFALWKLVGGRLWRWWSNRDGDAAQRPSWLVRRILENYDLNSSLFHAHDLECYLAEYFDPDFYGILEPSVVIEQSLKEGMSPSGCGSESSIRRGRKTIASYLDNPVKSRVALGLAVANIATGELEAYPPNQSVVRGLVASMAKLPWLPPQRLDSRTLYADGSTVTNVPTKALLEVLRKHVSVREDAAGVHLFSISPLPLTTRAHAEDTDRANPDPGSTDVIDVALDALRQQRFRDASLERSITRLYTRVLPSHRGGKSISKVSVPRDGESEDTEFFRIFTTPIETDSVGNQHLRILLAEDKQKQRQRIRQLVAEGCRQAMASLIRSPNHDADKSAMTCAEALRHYQASFDTPLQRQAFAVRLPGSAPQGSTAGPGLSEICKQCAMNKSSVVKEGSAEESRFETHSAGELDAAAIRTHAWPPEFDKGPCTPKADTASSGKSSKPFFKHLNDLNWPVGHQAGKPLDRPTVSLLFSGGVFRGVFQMGVINALREINLSPDIVAGSSIGAITAATATKALPSRAARDDATPGLDALDALQTARLAASYLAVDSLILTDRFADFVREFTVRAADSRFSIRQLDELFRKYDASGALRFSKDGRATVAGLERLFYVNPYQLNRLVASLRHGEHRQAYRLIVGILKQWLSKSGISEEALGAEPLKMLIENFVLEPGDTTGDRTLRTFYDRGVHFLCTATPLGGKDLLRLGLPLEQSSGLEDTTYSLVEALLSSSAFPGVFRPRSANELFPRGVSSQNLYIDGGVLDNLPIGSVPKLLNEAADSEVLARRPSNGVPHLIVSASLETQLETIDERRQLDVLEQYWPASWSRTRQLKYNKKVDLFEKTIKDRQTLYRHYEAHCAGEETRNQYAAVEEPLSLHLVSIKPRWLCGTFAFHPMLGYQRKKQAMSIAHGCASTLLSFRKQNPAHLRAWGVDSDRLPHATSFDEAFAFRTRWRRFHSEDSCWLQPGRQCPFSRSALRQLNQSIADKSQRLRERTIDELATIHRCCDKPDTHTGPG